MQGLAFAPVNVSLMLFNMVHDYTRLCTENTDKQITITSHIEPNLHMNAHEYHYVELSQT